MEMVCIVCPNGCRLDVTQNGNEISVLGNKCKRGEAFARTELTAPTRSDFGGKYRRGLPRGVGAYRRRNTQGQNFRPFATAEKRCRGQAVVDRHRGACRRVWHRRKRDYDNGHAVASYRVIFAQAQVGVAVTLISRFGNDYLRFVTLDLLQINSNKAPKTIY